MAKDNWISFYFKDPASGEVSEYRGYAIDAHDAVKRFPDQYRLTPWEDASPVAKAKQPEVTLRKTV